MKRGFWRSLFFLIILCISLGVTGCAGSSSALKDEEQESAGHAFSAKVLIQKADQLFKDKQYIESGQEYRNFLDLHPVHESASYAQYRIALCFFHQIDSIDRDMDPAFKALDAFQALLSVYPQNPFEVDARDKIHVIQNKLAERELYVGKFYFRKGSYAAAIERFKGVLRNYPASPVAETSLYHLGLAYEASGASSEAMESLKALLQDYPDTSYKGEASTVLNRLNGKAKAL